MSFAGLDLTTALRDPALFGPVFTSPNWDQWNIVLRAAHGEPLTDDELPSFKHAAGGRAPPPHRISEAVFIAGRGGGKTSAASIVATYAAITFDGHARLRPGEKAVVACLGFDRAQARQIMRFIGGLFESIPALASMVVSITDESIELNNNVAIEVFTSNFRSVRGRSIICAIFDEVAFWYDQNFANPDVEVHAAVTPGLGRVEGSMLVLISSPYKRSGLLHDMWKESFGRDDPDRLVVVGTTLDFNPTFDSKIIERDLARDRARFAAEYLAQWRDDLATFISRDLLDAAVDPGVVVRPPQCGVAYVAACDPSGGVHDSFTASITHLEGDASVLDLLYERRPPFNPTEVVTEIAELLRSYSVHEITGDRYAARWVIEAFEKAGIRYIQSERDRSAIYLDCLPLFTTGRARLVDNTRLINQFAALERRTFSTGRDRVDHGSSGSDDLCNSAALALVLVAGDARPSLINRTDLLPVDSNADLRFVTLFYTILWIGLDGTAAYAVFAASWHSNQPLILVDFERGAWAAQMMDSIASQLDLFCEEVRNNSKHHLQFGVSAILYAPEHFVSAAERSMMKAFEPRFGRSDFYVRRIGWEPIAPELLADPEKLFFVASAHTSAGKVKFGAAAFAKSRGVPLFGALALRPGEQVNADTLRVVLLVGIVVGLGMP